MNIPKTTKEKPYIEFRIDEKGKIKLSASSNWWGGKNGGFFSSNGEGNTCEPNDLKEYIKAFKEKKIKNIEKEILALQKQLEVVKTETERWDF